MGFYDRVAEAIRNNLPSRKPQLWDDLPLAIRRRLAYAVGRRLDAAWLDKPRLARLSRLPVQMQLLSRSLPERVIFLYGTYEFAATRFFKTFLKAGMAVADIGANVGYFSLVAAQLVEESGDVYAFEPVPAIVKRLRRNVELNSFDRVQVHERAVAGDTGEHVFYESNLAENQGVASLLPGDSRRDVGFRVQTVSIDDFIQSLREPRLDLIKIDVEGAETEVFAGAQKLLARPDAPALVFESFDVANHVDMLGSLGYTVRALAYSTARRQLEFLETTSSVDGGFVRYEAPNYVALKERGPHGTFANLAAASDRRATPRRR